MLEDLLGLFDNKMFLGLSCFFFYTSIYLLEFSFCTCSCGESLICIPIPVCNIIPYKHMIMAYKCIHSSLLSTLYLLSQKKVCSFFVKQIEKAKWIGALYGVGIDDSNCWMIAERWYFTSYRIVQPNSLKYSHF